MAREQLHCVICGTPLKTRYQRRDRPLRYCAAHRTAAAAKRGGPAAARARQRRIQQLEQRVHELERQQGEPSMAQRSNGKVRVALVGVGNCASSLIQGVQYYRDAPDDSFVPGLMHVNLGGYHIRDIEFSAAFDIDSRKVGLDLSEAINTEPNNTIKLADVPPLGVKVQRGMTHDGIGQYGAQKITKAAGPTDDVVRILKDSGTDVVVSYLPVGSEQATKWYVEQVLNAGCGFVNCVPQFIAREDYWQERFRQRGLPVIGDDIKSQVGATIVHRMPSRTGYCASAACASTAPISSISAETCRFQEYARTGAAGIEEDLQDPNAVTSQLNSTSILDDERHPCRAERPRALAHRPQVGLRAPGGPRVRRRAAQH